MLCFLPDNLLQFIFLFRFQIRQRLSDFGVLIAILVMVGLDALVGIDTPKLTVPTEFKVCQIWSFTILGAQPQEKVVIIINSWKYVKMNSR